ncbi:dynein axonemal assembly factor 5-like [Ostrea edulis]|uniref:dynein axonemal assembly factor 5-like n=1 Tax=Ostrea edulis TaxID=37623 RepID=UPI0024AF9D85|nr:dynein axonemal assembly factor 5-like [Ostrea edulis]
MACVDQNSNAVLQGIARHINCLGEENRNTRKKALESIKKDTLERKPPLAAPELQLVFSEVAKPLLKIFFDPVEKCRELSINIIREYMKNVEKPDESLPYVIPVLVQRLGQQEITEPSEEIRLMLIEFLSEILEFSGKKLSVYLDDLMRILQRTIPDPFPDVKKESCRCTSKIAKAIPEYFHMQSESLIKLLSLTITHQHAKVRTLVVETIGNVLQYGNGKSMESVVPHLAQRLFDDSPAVRKAVVKVVGGWLLDLPDRYSFHHKLIPLLLTGLADTQPEISELADSLWYDTGLKYEKENEQELKDQLDFSKEKPAHYPLNVERPNLGCRVLIMRHLSKILPALMKDVTDWVVATRLKSAALLFWLLLNAEDYVTQHMAVLTSGMYRACVDEEPQVVKDVQRAAELVGYFVSPEVWCKMILSNMKSMQSFSPLMILAAIIRGSERPVLRSYLPKIVSSLNDTDICYTSQVQMHSQLLNCTAAILKVCVEDCAAISQQLFDLLITILSQNQNTQEQVNEQLEKLYKVQVMESRQELFSKHTKPLIDHLKETVNMWSVHSTERLVFDTVLIECGSVVGDLLDDVIPIFVTNFDPDKDPEMRLKFFSLLSRLVMTSSSTLDSCHKFGDFAVSVVKDIIIPNCLWKAGRVAGAIRTTATSCMWALLQSGMLNKEKLSPVVEDLLTQMITTMDDDNKSTRLICCRVMTRLFDLMGGELGQDRLHNMYPDLLKRLDDSSDEVRITVSKTFLAYFDCFENGYDVTLYRAHLEAIYKGLLVHLDDPEQKIQEAILEVLKKSGSICPTMLLQEVEEVKHKHRTTVYCNKLMEHLKGLL